MCIIRVCYTFSILLFLTGCAYVSSSPYNPGSSKNGIPLPEQIPLLVVSGAKTEVIYANNPNRGSALRFGSFLAKHEFEAKFSDGSLGEIKSNQDTTEVAIKLIELVQESAKSGNPIGAAFSSKTGDTAGTVDRYGIFAFDFDNDGSFIGLTPLITSRDLIKVPKTVSTQINPAPQNGNTGPTRVN